MFERFTDHARQAVVLAQEQARELDHNYIGTEHLLLSLVLLPPEVGVTRALHQAGLSDDVVREAIVRLVGRGSRPASGGHIPFTPRCKKVMELSLREALRLHHHYIGAEHLLLGILREGGGLAAQVMAEREVDFDRLRSTVLAASGSAAPATTAGDRTPAADQVLAAAERLAGGAPVGTQHLLEALAREEGSVAGRALSGLGVTAEALIGQVDAIDPAGTTDTTPEQVAAASMRWEAGPDEVRLISADPDLVRRLTRLAEHAGGELRGDGPLAGPFIRLHRALGQSVTALESALRPRQADEEADQPGLVERLRRRRRQRPAT